MMSASAMSAAIRAKKKKMEEEHSDAVKLSGIPEDATDILINKNKEPGEMLSENHPKDRDEDPTLEAEVAKEKEAQPHEDVAPDPKLAEVEEDSAPNHELEESRVTNQRSNKIKRMMMRLKG